MRAHTLTHVRTTHARSSLWELDALQQHYSPTLAKFSNVFFAVFVKKEYDVDEFLAQDYSTVIVARRVAMLCFAFLLSWSAGDSLL